MGRIFLIRHGQTLWNHSMRYQGHMDIPLSDVGLEQARLLGERLRSEKLAAVYASDLSRARNTAQWVADPHGLPVQIAPELREMNFGQWEGLTFKEIQARFPEIATSWIKAPGKVQPPEGESFIHLQERACKIIKGIASRHLHESVAVVSHGGTIRAILCGLLGLDLKRIFCFRQDNGAMNVIDFYDEEIIIERLNDSSYLISGGNL